MRARMILVATAAAFALSACGGKSDDDLVYDAQDCLNRSSDGAALSCLDSLGALDSQAAHLLRCAAYFKREGISDPDNLAAIGQQISSSGYSAVMSMMSSLAFDSEVDVLTASAYCNKSGSKGLIMLSSMSTIATATLNAIGAIPPNPSAADLQNAICDETPGGGSDTSPATNAVIGTAVLAAYQQGCIGTNGASENPYCGMVVSATAASQDPAAVGLQFADLLCTP